jgi:hypothetical protein
MCKVINELLPVASSTTMFNFVCSKQYTTEEEEERESKKLLHKLY